MTTHAPKKITPPEYFKRMMQEHNELQERITKLNSFICFNAEFDALDEQDRYLLRDQIRFMRHYEAVLWERICKKSNELQEQEK